MKELKQLTGMERVGKKSDHSDRKPRSVFVSLFRGSAIAGTIAVSACGGRVTSDAGMDKKVCNITHHQSFTCDGITKSGLINKNNTFIIMDNYGLQLDNVEKQGDRDLALVSLVSVDSPVIISVLSVDSDVTVAQKCHALMSMKLSKGDTTEVVVEGNIFMVSIDHIYVSDRPDWSVSQVNFKVVKTKCVDKRSEAEPKPG